MSSLRALRGLRGGFAVVRRRDRRGHRGEGKCDPPEVLAGSPLGGSPVNAAEAEAAWNCDRSDPSGFPASGECAEGADSDKWRRLPRPRRLVCIGGRRRPREGRRRRDGRSQVPEVGEPRRVVSARPPLLCDLAALRALRGPDRGQAHEPGSRGDAEAQRRTHERGRTRDHGGRGEHGGTCPPRWIRRRPSSRPSVSGPAPGRPRCPLGGPASRGRGRAGGWRACRGASGG